MSKAKESKPKNKGGRPRKVAEMHEGGEAAKRFAAGLQFVISGGPEPTEKKPR